MCAVDGSCIVKTARKLANHETIDKEIEQTNRNYNELIEIESTATLPVDGVA